METDLNKASLEELQRRAVPNVVARAIVAEREQGGPFVDWEQFERRLFYASQAASGDDGGASSASSNNTVFGRPPGLGVVPEDRRLLQLLGITIGTDLAPKEGPPRWWANPLQRLAPPGAPPDDAFPAEFRARIPSGKHSGAAAGDDTQPAATDVPGDQDQLGSPAASGAGGAAQIAHDREIHFCYLFAQVAFTPDSAPPPLAFAPFMYLGYPLDKAAKDSLLARWAKEYPELDEGALSGWDVDRGGLVAAHLGSTRPVAGSTGGAATLGGQQYAEVQVRRFRADCWAALGRGALPPDSSSSSSKPSSPQRLPSKQMHTRSPSTGVPAVLDGSTSAAGGSTNKGNTLPLPSWLGALEPGLPAGALIPEELRVTYRVDPYGNVVASESDPSSICAWEVDHVFPRRRGGRSVLQNLVATHWYAQRHVKTHKVLASLLVARDGRNPLTTGLTEPGLAALWEARTAMPPALQGSNAFGELLRALLCTAWRRGDQRELFNVRAGLLHVTPHDQLFTVLLQEFQAATTSLVAGWHMGLLVASSSSGGGAPVGGTSPPPSPSRLGQEGDTQRDGDGPSPPRSPSSVPAGGAPVSPSRLGSTPPGTAGAVPAPHHARSGSMSRIGSGARRGGGGGRMSRLRMGSGALGGQSQGSLPQYGSGSLQAPSSPAGGATPSSPPWSSPPTQQAAIRAFNQVLALAKEANIPQLATLPMLEEEEGTSGVREEGSPGAASHQAAPGEESPTTTMRVRRQAGTAPSAATTAGRPSATSPFASLAAWGMPPDSQAAPADSAAPGTEGAVQGTAGVLGGGGAGQSGGRNGRQRLRHSGASAGVVTGSATGVPAVVAAAGATRAGATISGAGSSAMDEASSGGVDPTAAAAGGAGVGGLQQGKGAIPSDRWRPPEPDPKPKRARPRMASASTQTAGEGAAATGEEAAGEPGSSSNKAGKPSRAEVSTATKAPAKRANNSKARAKAAAAKAQEAGLQGVAQAGYEGSALPLPPPMPPSRVTMEEALAQATPVLPPWAVHSPLYVPPHGPLTGAPPPRPRNPVTDSYITELYDHHQGGASAPGSAASALGIIEGAVAAAKAEAIANSWHSAFGTAPDATHFIHGGAGASWPARKSTADPAGADGTELHPVLAAYHAQLLGQQKVQGQESEKRVGVTSVTHVTLPETANLLPPHSLVTPSHLRSGSHSPLYPPPVHPPTSEATLAAAQSSTSHHYIQAQGPLAAALAAKRAANPAGVQGQANAGYDLLLQSHLHNGTAADLIPVAPAAALQRWHLGLEGAQKVSGLATGITPEAGTTSSTSAGTGVTAPAGTAAVPPDTAAPGVLGQPPHRRQPGHYQTTHVSATSIDPLASDAAYLLKAPQYPAPLESRLQGFQRGLKTMGQEARARLAKALGVPLAALTTFAESSTLSVSDSVAMQRYMSLLRQQGALLLLEQEEREEQARRAAAAGTGQQGVQHDSSNPQHMQHHSAADGTAAVHVGHGTGGFGDHKLSAGSKDGVLQQAGVLSAGEVRAMGSAHGVSPAVHAMAGQYITLPLWPGGPVPATNPHLGPGKPHPELLEHLADRQAKFSAMTQHPSGPAWFGGSQPGTLPLDPNKPQQQQQQQQGHAQQGAPQHGAPQGSAQQTGLPLPQQQQPVSSQQPTQPAPAGFAFGENKAVGRLNQVPYQDAPPWPPTGAPLPPWHPSYLAHAPQGPWTEHLHVKPQVPQQPPWLPPGSGAVAVGPEGGLYSVDPGAQLRGPTPEDLRAALAQRMQELQAAAVAAAQYAAHLAEVQRAAVLTAAQHAAWGQYQGRLANAKVAYEAALAQWQGLHPAALPRASGDSEEDDNGGGSQEGVVDQEGGDEGGAAAEMRTEQSQHPGAQRGTETYGASTSEAQQQQQHHREHRRPRPSGAGAGAAAVASSPNLSSTAQYPQPSFPSQHAHHQYTFPPHSLPYQTPFQPAAGYQTVAQGSYGLHPSALPGNAYGYSIAGPHIVPPHASSMYLPTSYPGSAQLPPQILTHSPAVAGLLQSIERDIALAQGLPAMPAPHSLTPGSYFGGHGHTGHTLPGHTPSSGVPTAEERRAAALRVAALAAGLLDATASLMLPQQSALNGGVPPVNGVPASTVLQQQALQEAGGAGTVSSSALHAVSLGYTLPPAPPPVTAAVQKMPVQVHAPPVQVSPVPQGAPPVTAAVPSGTSSVPAPQHDALLPYPPVPSVTGSSLPPYPPVPLNLDASIPPYPPPPLYPPPTTTVVVTESGTQQGAVADHTGINSQGNNNSSSTGTAADGLGSSAEGAITTAAGGAALVRGPAGGDETVAEQHTSPGLQLGPQLRTSTTSEGAIGQSPDRSPGKAKKGIWGSITSLFRSSSSGSPAKAVDQGIQGPTSGHISAGGRTGSHNTGDEKEEEEQHALIGDLPASLDAVQEEDGEEEEENEDDQQDASKQKSQLMKGQSGNSQGSGAGTASAGAGAITTPASSGSSADDPKQQPPDSSAGGPSEVLETSERRSGSGVGSGFRGKPRRPGGKQRMGVTFASTTTSAPSDSAANAAIGGGGGSDATQRGQQGAGADQPPAGGTIAATSSATHSNTSAQQAPRTGSPQVPPLPLSLTSASPASPASAAPQPAGAAYSPSPSTSNRQSLEGGPSSLNATFRLRGSSLRRSLMAGEVLGGGALSPGRSGGAGASGGGTSPRGRASVGGGGGGGTTVVATAVTTDKQGGGGVPPGSSRGQGVNASLVAQEGLSGAGKADVPAQRQSGTKGNASDGYSLDQLMAASLPAPRFK